MTANHNLQQGLGERIPLVGRQGELTDLEKMLKTRGDSHVVYIKGEGGTGKTRILNELVGMVDRAGLGFLSTGIIDLYHTDNHTTSDVERIIVERFDPDNKYFKEYRNQRKLYTDLRERGSSTEMLERMRKKLHRTLITEWGPLANDTRKLVLIFDTVELIQYESTIVEETAGLDSVDTQVKTWLLTVLPELKNVLVVFAGRPKEDKAKRAENESDHQTLLEKQMRAAFSQKGMEFDVSRCPITLKGLTIDETRDFLTQLCSPDEVIPEDILPVVHTLTSGAPIFLHLIVDLMRRLTDEYKGLLEWFRQNADVTSLKENDPRLEKARLEVKTRIVRGIFNEADELGLYLSRIAMMPKGIDMEVLDAALGIPEAEAQELLSQLENLSFVKRFYSQTNAPTPFENRLFLHDEMYKLFRLTGVIPDLMVSERQIASTLVRNYYDPKIQQLEHELKALTPEERNPVRRQLQKLEVERLYYMLVQNPLRGFEEYQRLSDEANRSRYVGFSMRLHDEFLRFYNNEERHKQFIRNGILDDRVVRESAEMWIERFHWWGQYAKEIAFAERIFEDPGRMHLDPEKHVEILGNIAALYGRAKAMTSGFDLQTAEHLEKMIACQPDPARTPKQILTRSRLAISLGFLYVRGGRYGDATRYYVAAQGGLDKLEQYQDELSMLLNNLSFVYARQGRFELATPLIKRSLKLNESPFATDGSTGLSYSTRAGIEIARGHYQDAVQYAEMANDKFEHIQDPWGEILALQSITQARRKLAKNAIRQGLNLDEAARQLEDARGELLKAVELAKANGFESQLSGLYAELGKLYREMGQLARTGMGKGRPDEHFERSYSYFHDALVRMDALQKDNSTQAMVNKAETQVDLAELLFYRGAPEQAEEMLNTALAEIGPDFQLVHGKDLADSQQVCTYFPPLGKVERLFGQIAFDRKMFADGLMHMYRAFIYFNLFSESAPEKQPIIDFVYEAMLVVSVEERRVLITNLQATVADQYLQYEPTGFINTLQALLG